MTETLYPASLRARASCQTRRSNGTGRFSTMMQTATGALVISWILGRPCLTVRSGSAPQFKVYESPELFLAIAHAVEVFTHKPLHACRIEVPPRLCLGRQHQVGYHGLQRFPEPDAHGNRETHFAAPKRFRRQVRPERLLEEK